MGRAKNRGTREERVQQAIQAGRTKKPKPPRERPMNAIEALAGLAYSRSIGDDLSKLRLPPDVLQKFGSTS